MPMLTCVVAFKFPYHGFETYEDEISDITMY